MKPKPDICKGCPFYGCGHGFVADLVATDPNPMVLVMDAPERGEVVTGEAFTGPRAKKLERDYLPLAQLEAGVNLAVIYVVRCWPSKTSGRDVVLSDPYKSEDFAEASRHCRRHDNELGRELVTVGPRAFDAFVQETPNPKHKDWRGFRYETDDLSGN